MAAARQYGSADRVARSALTLGLVGASVVLFVQVIFLKRTQDFLLSNQLGSVRGRTLLILTIVAGAILPNLMALAGVIWRGRVALERTHVLATRLSPLALLFMTPILFIQTIGQGQPLFYLVVLGLFALGMHQLMPRAFASFGDAPPMSVWYRLRHIRLSTKVCTIVVVTAAAVFAVYMSYHTILMHRLISTTAFDLGIYDNLMYNALKGHPFSSPVLFGPGSRSYLAGHAEFAMLLFVPFYAIRPDAETMLIIQAAVLGGAAIPLYLLARLRMPAPAAVVVSLAYLLFAPLHGPMFYDFHWLPLVIFFLFWTFYGVATSRHWLTMAAVIVVWLIREDTAVGVAFFGLYLIVTGFRPAVGFVLALVSTIWFVIVRFIIMPRAGTWFFPQLYNALFADGQGTFESVIRTLITNPVYVLSTLLKEPKLIYVLHMVVALAFLPVRRPVYVLLLIPGAIFTVLTTEAAPMVAISFQYTSHVVPYVFLATVLALGTLAEDRASRFKFTAAVVILAFTVLSHSYNFGAMLQRQRVIGGWRQVTFTMSPEAKVRYQALRELVNKIPRKASVAATEFMSPHVSSRITSYVLRNDVDDVDYVLLSNREINDDYRRKLITLFSRTKYGLAGYTGNEFYLFQKGMESPTTAEGLIRLGIYLPAK
jgi:uncharacterized membrane protein